MALFWSVLTLVLVIFGTTLSVVGCFSACVCTDNLVSASIFFWTQFQIPLFKDAQARWAAIGYI